MSDGDPVPQPSPTAREAELEARLAAAEKNIARLTNQNLEQDNRARRASEAKDIKIGQLEKRVEALERVVNPLRDFVKALA